MMPFRHAVDDSAGPSCVISRTFDAPIVRS